MSMQSVHEVPDMLRYNIHRALRNRTSLHKVLGFEVLELRRLKEEEFSDGSRNAAGILVTFRYWEYGTEPPKVTTWVILDDELLNDAVEFVFESAGEGVKIVK